MVRTWAEKEMRNLKRLAAAGIPCPLPRLLKQHVLIMDFLGNDGWCAPRLKEVCSYTLSPSLCYFDFSLPLPQVDLSLEESIFCYRTIVIDMRRMYHECNLVHGDLSEYNLLWYRNRPVIIDVSQSVEHAHPFANDFLKKDVQNINEFFSKREVSTLSNYHLFQFITVNKENLICMLDTAVKDMATQQLQQSQGEGKGEQEKGEKEKEELSSLSEIVSQMLSQLPTETTTASPSAPVVPAPVIPSTLPISDEPLDAHLQSAHQLTDLPVSVLEYLLTRFLSFQEFQNERNATQSNSDSNESEIQEAVFLQSYIPSSLNEFSNPATEKNKLEKGQREAAYTSAINQMLSAAPPPLLTPAPAVAQKTQQPEKQQGQHGKGKAGKQKGQQEQQPEEPVSEVRGKGKGAKKAKAKAREIPLSPPQQQEQQEPEQEADRESEESNDSDSDSESGSVSSSEGEEDWESGDEKEKKYRRRLPGTDSNPEERKAMKDERKEAKRLAKEMAALKRTQKVPKHVKKRAVKSGKKK
jgi:RIO kinase 1